LGWGLGWNRSHRYRLRLGSSLGIPWVDTAAPEPRAPDVWDVRRATVFFGAPSTLSTADNTDTATSTATAAVANIGRARRSPCRRSAVEPTIIGGTPVARGLQPLCGGNKCPCVVRMMQSPVLHCDSRRLSEVWHNFASSSGDLSALLVGSICLPATGSVALGTIWKSPTPQTLTTNRKF
jgi:hypothetical protein